MKKYTTSIEVSKKLAKVLPEGFESEQYWVRSYTQEPPYRGVKELKKTYSKYYFYSKKELRERLGQHPDVKNGVNLPIEYIPALIFEEVLGMLPSVIFGERGGAYHWQHTIGRIEYVKISGKGEESFKGSLFGYTASGRFKEPPATAAAKLYLWLHENGYIK